MLPYRFGTHSGWLEACYDLGTAVVAPSCGFYAEQQPCVTYRHDEDGLDADSLAAAVRRVLRAAAGAARATPATRLRGAPRRWPPRTGALYARLLRMSGCASGSSRPSRFPIAEPFAGGLEAHVWALADGLRRRGHEVTLFAGPGSDPRLGVELLDLRRPRHQRRGARGRQHDRAGLARRAPRLPAADAAARGGPAPSDFDVIHNHSLHHLPIAMAATVADPDA